MALRSFLTKPVTSRRNLRVRLVMGGASALTGIASLVVWLGHDHQAAMWPLMAVSLATGAVEWSLR